MGRHRTRAKDKFASKGRQGRQNVLKINDGIDTVALGEQRYFCGRVRIAEQRLQGPAVLLAQRNIFRVRAAGLAHQPDRRPRRRLTARGAFEQIISECRLGQFIPLARQGAGGGHGGSVGGAAGQYGYDRTDNRKTRPQGQRRDGYHTRKRPDKTEHPDDHEQYGNEMHSSCLRR